MSVECMEKNFEDSIENCLLSNDAGYVKGDAKSFNKDIGIDKNVLIKFIKETQEKEWEKLTKFYGVNTEAKFIERLNNFINEHGLLWCLRNFVEDMGIKFKLVYFKPISGLNEKSIELYNKNILQVTRQLQYSLQNNNSLDTVLFINGLPLVTLELKNQLSSQNVQNAKIQYKHDRDPKEIIFTFNKRSLVHFAVDTDEVWMTTKLAGENTYFLPFNKGYNNGAGNPPSENGVRTDYLWKKILTKDSLLDIINKFLHLEIKEETFDSKKTKKETMIFPRYHQLDVVRKIVEDVKSSGTGENYLIQHSAGSGKSNSIAWLSHHLASLHDSENKNIFNSVIVITDRRVLDRQLQNTIEQFEHTQGVVKKIDKNSTQLADALNNGEKIIITTLQKFPFIMKKVDEFKGKNFAIIVDEAHSSQTGKASTKLKEILADIPNYNDKDIEEKLAINEEKENELERNTPESDDEILKEIMAQGRNKNLSFFAFTATPKNKTLEVFGRIGEDGKPHPFHLYSMRQAIEEGFILDVLSNYITYETYFKIGKVVKEDPSYNKAKANKALGKFLALHPHNLAQKAEIMVEHFRNITRREIGGKAKAMLVTSSRLQAVRYFHAFKEYIRGKNYKDMDILVAFSGTVLDSGEEFTEIGLNKISESELPKKFKTNMYQILLVAEKYQTGYDEPLLHTMFVDKKLSGVKAVQTLSRLNRICKGKTNTFILDFTNKKEDILESFQPYYEKTELEKVTDPNLIFDIKLNLDKYNIYLDTEIDNFAKIFFKPTKKQGNMDFELLNVYIDPAVDRYKSKEVDEKETFKDLLNKFVRIYSFITQVINLDNIELHKFYSFAKCLLRKLPKESNKENIFIDNDVSLQYYRIQKIFEGKIELEKNEDGLLKPPSYVGGKKQNEEKSPLSIIIEKLNEKFGISFTEMDKVLEQFISDLNKDEDLRTSAKNNTMDNFIFSLQEALQNVAFERRNQNQAFCDKILDGGEYYRDIVKLLLPIVYENLNKK